MKTLQQLPLCHYKSPTIYQKNLEKNEKPGLKEIINYFKELQHQDLDKNDGGIVYRGLATLAPGHLETKNIKGIN